MPAKVDLIESYRHMQLAASCGYWDAPLRIYTCYFCLSGVWVVLSSARGMDLFYAHLALQVLLSLRERIEVRGYHRQSNLVEPFATTNRTGRRPSERLYNGPETCSLHIRVRAFTAFGDEAVDPRRDNSTASWNARMLNFAPSVFSAFSRARTIATSPSNKRGLARARRCNGPPQCG